MSRASGGSVTSLLRDYRRYAGTLLWVALGLMVLGALAEGFGLLMIVPLASIAIGNDDGVWRFAPILRTVPSEERFLLALSAFLLSPSLALIGVAILLLGSMAAVSWTRRGVASGIALAERSEQSTESGFRLHAGLKAALAQGSVPQFLSEYAVTLDRARDEAVRFAKDLNSTRQWAALAAAIAAALLLFVGVQLLALPFPVLIASLALFARMVAPAQILQQSAQN